MKVGILTFSGAYNYGAILQAYALQKKIIEIGKEAILIDYKCHGVEHQYSYRIPRTLVDFKINTMLLITRNKRKKMDQFREQMTFTEQYTKDKIGELDLLMDCFIVGSDQVWNKECSRSDTTFFLDFVNNNNKKNSYAASFGKMILEDEDKVKYQHFLAQFKHISVREKSAKKIVELLVKESVQTVLDPVFLLKQNQWVILTTKIKKKYIFLLQYISNVTTIKLADKFAKEKGYELIICSTSPYAFLYGTVVLDFGIEEFLSYISSAELVITDSFHCSAFAIIFNRPFYSQFREKDPANTRLDNLFDLFEISNRDFTTGNLKRDEKINYKRVNELLTQKRLESLEYLYKILGN